MASPTTEPRALSAALDPQRPAWATRVGGIATHVADRHVEKWAPETAAGNSRVRSMRALGFVDRLVSPWVEAAQRSASLRLFSQYRESGLPQAQGRDVSWVFPRPWYQDELDWMAAARRAPVEQSSASLFTTRGTYVPAAQQQRTAQVQSQVALSPALYEYVAPSLSVAAPTVTSEIGYGGDATTSRRVRTEAFSPLVPLAAVQAAEVMSRTVSRLPATVAATPALRSVLATLLERTTRSAGGDVIGEAPVTRTAMTAPELVTPPAPRDDQPLVRPTAPASAPLASRVAERYAEQHAQLAEVQRIARQSIERAAIERTAASSAPTSPVATTASGSSVPTSTTTTTEQQARALDEVLRTQQATQQQIEERVARRVAERAAQRLHDQARTEAAAHARAATIAQVEATASVPSAPRVASSAAPVQAPPALAAAMASLPPELATLLAQRPERAVETIDELDRAYRTVELLARSAAAGSSFEVTRGPRLMMPAGLGGLVAAVDHAPSSVPAPIVGVGFAGSTGSLPALTAARAADARVRMPALPQIAPRVERRSAVAPTSALGATAAAMPAALTHVAWSDRWLARFAGASSQSLDTLSVGTTREERTAMPRILGLSSSAPDSVFVSPTFDAVRDGEQVRFDARGHAVVTPAQPQRFAPVAAQVAPAVPSEAPSSASVHGQAPVVASSDGVLRFDDSAETPDDVFAAISAAATQRRAAPAMPAIALQASSSLASSAPAPVARAHEVERPSIADLIAHAAPSAPAAGLAAQLAASPFAPALRHVLSIPSATSFDVRALFGGALSSTYLAGLLAPEAHEIEVATRALPSWPTERWMTLPEDEQPARAIPEWDAAYVSPDVEHVETEAGVVEARTILQQPSAAAIAAAATPLTTVRSALLSWEAELPALAAASGVSNVPGAASVSGSTAVTDLRARALEASTARELIDAMTLPLLGDALAPRTGESWAAPGMVAERAHGWSVAQERSSADLAFDFVPPELVLAARVYGLGPAEAAQAARLAIVGPGPLSAMASTVDRTFVQAMAFEADRRERVQAARTQLAAVDPIASPVTAAGATPAVASTTASVAASPGELGLIARELGQPAISSFGVERRAPRGAFLWPQATVAALKLDAPTPDGQQSMSIAALELLAAQTVAELGTYAALADLSPETLGTSAGSVIGAAGSPVGSSPAIAGEAAIAAGTAELPGRATSRAELVEPDEQEVLQAAAALVPESRRARFDALYVALGRSPASVGVSPAARAARALALAGRGEDAPLSARERAAAAWDVLPVVYAVELGEAAASYAHEASGGAALTGGARERAAARASAREYVGSAGRESIRGVDTTFVDVRPGLGRLSERAGEALGSYVTPTAASSSLSSSSSSSSVEREVGALLRAPSAPQELVQTGRPSGRYGGGEVEIPTWFEAAARKMFESQQSSLGGDISLAELTLISSAPATQLAASTRGTPGAASPLAPGAGNHAEAKPGQKIDIEKIANEVYRQILAMMDAARARNGEPYL